MNIRNENKNGERIPVMVFRNEKDGKVTYNIGLSRKVMTGDKEEWKNGYILAQFNKEVSLENKTKIYLNSAILDFYLTQENRTVPFIRVFEYEVAETNDDGYIKIPDGDELPF